MQAAFSHNSTVGARGFLPRERCGRVQRRADRSRLTDLLRALKGNRYMRAVPCDSLPRTRPVSKWWGGKPIAAAIPKVRVAPPSPTPPNGLPPPARRSRLDRNQRAKLARLLEAFNRRTREVGESGRRNQGALKASGVEIGKALMFDWYNPDTGQLDPSDDTIAKETGWSVRTVARARERLRASGLLSWFRRSKWAAGAWKPLSNRYVIGQTCRESSGKRYKEWGLRVAAPPSALILTLASEMGVAL